MTDDGAGRILECSYCHTRETPVWRLGPKGAKTLCNACGIRWKRNRQRIKPKKVPGAKKAKKGGAVGKNKGTGVTAPPVPIIATTGDADDNFNGEEHLIHHASRRGGPLPVYYDDDSDSEEEDSPSSSPPSSNYSVVGTSTRATVVKEDQNSKPIRVTREGHERKPTPSAPKSTSSSSSKASPIKRTKTPASALPASATYATEPPVKKIKTHKNSTPVNSPSNGKGSSSSSKQRGRPRVHPPPGTVNPLSVRSASAHGSAPVKPIVRYGHSSGSELSSDEDSMSESDSRSSSRSRSQSRDRKKRRRSSKRDRERRRSHHRHHHRRRYSYSDSDSSSASDSDSEYDSDSSFSSPELRRRGSSSQTPGGTNLEPLMEKLETLSQTQNNTRRRVDEMNGLITSTSERVGSIMSGGVPMPDLITSRDDPDAMVSQGGGDLNGNHHNGTASPITSLGDLSSAEVLMAWNSDAPNGGSSSASSSHHSRGGSNSHSTISSSNSSSSNRGGVSIGNRNNHFIIPPKRNVTVRHLGSSPLGISSSSSKGTPNGTSSVPREEEKNSGSSSLNDEEDIDTGGKTIHHLPPPLPPHLQHHLNNHFSLQFGGGSHYLGLLRRGGPGSLTSSLTSSNEGDMTKSLECIESMDSEKEDDLSTMASNLAASLNRLPPEQRTISLMSLMPSPSPSTALSSSSSAAASSNLLPSTSNGLTVSVPSIASPTPNQGLQL